MEPLLRPLARAAAEGLTEMVVEGREREVPIAPPTLLPGDRLLPSSNAFKNVHIDPGFGNHYFRMAEKLFKYSPPHPRATWPFAANILDPVRCSIICPSTNTMLQVVSADHGIASTHYHGH